jgi:hypothetical protein
MAAYFVSLRSRRDTVRWQIRVKEEWHAQEMLVYRRRQCIDTVDLDPEQNRLY